MAKATPCQTHDAVYGVEIDERQVSVTVELPFSLKLAQSEKDLLEANLHNVVELVLVPYWPGRV